MCTRLSGGRYSALPGPLKSMVTDLRVSGTVEMAEISKVPGRTAADTSAKTFAFVSGNSVTASMTAVASAAALTDRLCVKRPG